MQVQVVAAVIKDQNKFLLGKRSLSKKSGVYTAPSLEKAGFIHCSLAHQIPAVANYNFKGQQGLVLLEIVGSYLSRMRLGIARTP